MNETYDDIQKKTYDHIETILSFEKVIGDRVLLKALTGDHFINCECCYCNKIKENDKEKNAIWGKIYKFCHYDFGTGRIEDESGAELAQLKEWQKVRYEYEAHLEAELALVREENSTLRENLRKNVRSQDDAFVLSLKREIERMRDVLRRVQYQPSIRQEEWHHVLDEYCIACHGWKRDGCETGCWLAPLLNPKEMSR